MKRDEEGLAGIQAKKLREELDVWEIYWKAKHIATNAGVGKDTYERITKRGEDLTQRTRNKMWNSLGRILDDLQEAHIKSWSK